jgi:hypothetical protein
VEVKKKKKSDREVVCLEIVCVSVFGGVSLKGCVEAEGEKHG